MRNRRRLALGLGIALGLLVVLTALIGVGAVTMGNDLVCSETEQRAMSEFPHYDAAEPEWDSNAKITGGCTTSYTVQAESDEVRTYYQERLSQSGWTVRLGPVNTFPIYLEADRDDLGYYLMFEGADSFDPSNQEQEGDVLRPGQTRVSISGGHRR